VQLLPGEVAVTVAEEEGSLNLEVEAEVLIRVVVRTILARVTLLARDIMHWHMLTIQL
jgi:hypothetical protein